jgi:hypothetical protein
LGNRKSTGPSSTAPSVPLFPGDFTEAVQAGKNPDMAEYLKRCPGPEARMRPILETALLLSRETARFRQKHPHVNLGRLFVLKRRSRPRKK